MIIHQVQRWAYRTKHIFMEEHASVQLELYNKYTEDGTRAYIYALWTDDGFRRRGRAKKLLQLAEEEARTHGYMKVRLDFSSADSADFVLNWYLRNGYKVIGYDQKYNRSILEKTLI
jgi:ribosomal protein S18 acetylase RimI-like enzyme